MNCAAFLVHLAVLGSPVQPADVSPQDSPTRKSLRDFDQQITAALRHEAVAENAAGREAALRTLVQLHDEIAADARLATSPTLKHLGMKIRARLRRAEKQLVRAARAVDSASHITASQAGAAGGRAQQANNGQALVELIQRTISPDIWDVNGGDSTVVYYAPRQVLVIRAPGEVHSRTRRVLNDLR